MVAAHAKPWPGEIAVYRSAATDGFALLTTFGTRARMGVLAADFFAGPVSRFDLGNALVVDLYSGTLESVTDITLLGGANALAVETGAGQWEIVQAGAAELIAPGRYRLTRLLRGQRGTEGAMVSMVPTGARVVVLDTAVASLPISEADLGLPWNWRIGPASKPVSDETFVAATFTPEGAGLRPFSVAHVEQPWRTARSPGDLTIRWTRRSRSLAADTWGAGDVPLAEDSEAYEVEIRDGGSRQAHADHHHDQRPLHRRAADRRLGRTPRPRPIPRHPHLPALGPDRPGRWAIRHAHLLKAALMSDITTHLLLPYILASQAQKHVTHNEALRLLDAMVQLSVLDRTRTAPPVSPTDGDRHIVASGATGLWAGWDLNVAFWVDGVWMRLVPRPGWLAWIADEASFVVWNGSAWDLVGEPVDVSDAIFSLVNDADPTKKALFSLSGISTGTTRTFTLPNTSSELAILAGTQTFTGNKTFSGTLTASGTVTVSGGGGHDRHGGGNRHLWDGHRGHDDRRHQDPEPRHRRRVRIDHRRQHRLGHSWGGRHHGGEHADGHLRQCRHAGRHAAGQPDRAAPGPRWRDGRQLQPSVDEHASRALEQRRRRDRGDRQQGGGRERCGLRLQDRVLGPGADRPSWATTTSASRSARTARPSSMPS